MVLKMFGGHRFLIDRAALALLAAALRIVAAAATTAAAAAPPPPPPPPCRCCCGDHRDASASCRRRARPRRPGVAERTECRSRPGVGAAHRARSDAGAADRTAGGRRRRRRRGRAIGRQRLRRRGAIASTLLRLTRRGAGAAGGGGRSARRCGAARWRSRRAVSSSTRSRVSKRRWNFRLVVDRARDRRRPSRAPRPRPHALRCCDGRVVRRLGGRRRRRMPDASAGAGVAGAAAAGAAAAVPRRRRAGGAVCFSARTRFSRSQRARMRATWSSVSRVRWLRTGTSI